MYLEKEITMKKIATTLLFLAVAAACLGQDRNIRRWSEGIKDWSGYQVVDPGHVQRKEIHDKERDYLSIY